MASTPTTIWTALPNGLVTGAATGGSIPQLSIYVSLRFDDPVASKLGDYTTGNWPTQIQTFVNQQKLRVQLGDSASPPNVMDMQLSVAVASLDPTLWDALFPSTTLVKPFAFQDHSARAIRSYSVKAIHEYIESVYTNVANASPSDFPDLNAAGDVGNLVQGVSGVMTEVARLGAATGAQGPAYNPPLPPNLANGTAGPHPDASLEAMFDKKAASVDPSIPGAELYRAYRFYNRGQQEAYRSNALPRAIADIPPIIDPPKFDIQEVISALGDQPAILRKLGLVIDCTFLGTIPAGATFDRIRVAVGDPAGGPPSPTDKTPWTLLDVASFLPQAKAGSDILGGYLQLGDPKRFGVTQADVDGGALRTIDYGANMARLLAARKLELTQRCEAAGLLVPNKPQPEPQSLPALRTTGIMVYRTDRDQALFDQLMTAAGNNMDPGNALLYWDDVTRGYRVDVGVNGNWYSLCARVPSYVVGTSMIMPGQDEGYVKAASGTSVAKDPPMAPPVKDLYLHETMFGWENWSLVVPRPGRSISIDRNDKDRTQTEVVRQEPNPANPDFPIAISSTVPSKTLPPLRFGRTYQLRARVVDLAGNSLALSTRAAKLITTEAVTYRRYEPVAPPALVLKDPLTPGESVEYLVMRTKVGSDSIADEGKIFNATTERHVSPPKTSQHTAELHGAFDALFPDAAAVYKVAIKESGTWQDPGGDVQLIDASGASVDPAPLDMLGEPLPDGNYVIHTDASPALPYLPDPVATGAALQIPGGFLQIDYAVGKGGWPDLAVLPLTLEASPDAGATFDDKGGFSVGLPRGTMLTLRYSSSIADADLPLMARWSAMSATARAAMMSNGGQHWMLTPYREVTFVHAVQKPLEQPVIDPLTVARNLGESFVTLSAAIANHSQSTGRLELLAAWTETVDRLSEKGPTMDDRSGRVFERDIGYDESKLMLPPPCETTRHEFGDTKHRWVKYHADATTRYREHFPTLVSMPELLKVSSNETDKINIPNAARPDSPKILYIIPTFAWTLSDDKTQSTRTGRGLRVYVDRTWYSSGDDEMLGVLVPDEGQPVADALKKYVSQWGSDPIWALSGPSTEMTLSSFVYDTTDPTSMPMVGASLQLAEADLSVTAVGIPPQYNADRQLYFFDIVLDPGTSYFAFVRLVLARFQPYSVDGAHLSRSVRADFAQLVADRLAAITYHDTSVDVSVSGVMPTSLVEVETKSGSGGKLTLVRGGLNQNRAAGKGRLVSAYVEQRKNPKLGDLGWELVGNAVYLQPYTTTKEPDAVYFRGNVPLPSTFGDKSEYRLVVEERELFVTDLPLLEPDLPVDGPVGAYRTRLVYLDTLPLSK
ncbi:MAG: hypothetical protein ACHQ53_00465 [Polyangiales bacterium]